MSAVAALRYRLLPHLLGAAVALFGLALPAAAQRVEIVLSEGSDAYQEAASAIAKELAVSDGVAVVTADQLERGVRRSAFVTVALGTRALQAVLGSQGRQPVIAALVPRSAYERSVRGAARAAESRPVSAIYLDQPYSRQLNLVREVAPGRTRVGVLASAQSEDAVKLLLAAAREQRLSIVRENVAAAGDLAGALTRVLAESDLLLALPDPLLFNSGTIHNILLSAYRARVPMIGFSAAYVGAGALAAVYSTPSQIGREAAELVQRVLAGGALLPPQYPRRFVVKLNATVARSLGLALENEETLQAGVQRLEREP